MIPFHYHRHMVQGPHTSQILLCRAASSDGDGLAFCRCSFRFWLSHILFFFFNSFWRWPFFGALFLTDWRISSIPLAALFFRSSSSKQSTLLLLPCFLWCYCWSSSSSIWPLAVCIYSRTGSHNPIAIEGTYLNGCKFVKVVLTLVFMTSVILQGSENGAVPDMSFRISSSSWVNVFLSRSIPITWRSSVQTCTVSSS